MRTKQEARESIEKLLQEAASPGEFKEMWESSHRNFSLTAYFVRGEIVIVQIFDNGSVYPYLSVNTNRWDILRIRIMEHFGQPLV